VDSEELGRRLVKVYPRLKAYARSLLRADHGVEDLTHDTVLRCLEYGPRFDPDRPGVKGDAVRAWAMTVMRSLFFSQIVQHSRSLVVSGADELAHARPDPMDRCSDFRVDARAALTKLYREHPERVEYLLLRYRDGMSKEDIAGRFATSRSTVGSGLWRGQQELRRLAGLAVS
jgi:RNA polymerase sigma factor (sigma-70 family)